MVSLSLFRRKKGLLDVSSSLSITRCHLKAKKKKRTKKLLHAEGLWICYYHRQFQWKSGRRNRGHGSSQDVEKYFVHINQTRAVGKNSGSKTEIYFSFACKLASFLTHVINSPLINSVAHLKIYIPTPKPPFFIHVHTYEKCKCRFNY